MTLPIIQNLRQLRQTAKSMSLKAPRGLESVLGSLGVGREAPGPVSRTTLQHLAKYMVHLSDKLPRILDILANPKHWRIERLLDPVSLTLRRPKIYLGARISEDGALAVRWSRLPSVSLDNDNDTPSDQRDVSDFNNLPSTWPFEGAPEFTLVRLTAEEHPASRCFGLDDEEALIQEQDNQRDAFLAFLVAIVNSLRAVVDVEIEDWVDFDDPWCLNVVPFDERVRRLAKGQHDIALWFSDYASQIYEGTLSRAGVTDKQLQVALADESQLLLREVFESVFGCRVSQLQIRACVRENDAVTAARDYEAQCNAILAEAVAARC